MVFAIVVAALYGGVALGGRWQPKLGLDLQGGTSITLTAVTKNGAAPSQENLQKARGIIDQRVNGSGVAEAEVSTQGNSNIVVQIPGKNAKKLVDTVKRTAQLRFRLVAVEAPGRPQPKAKTPSPSAAPSSSSSPKAKSPSAGTSPSASASGSPRGRALSDGLVAADGGSPTPKPSSSASSDASTAPSTTPSVAPSTPAAPPVTKKGAPVDQPLQWIENPGSKWLKKFATYQCPKKTGSVPPAADDPDKPLITCNDTGQKFLLSPAMIEGTQLTKAAAGIPQQQVQWVVTLTFDGSGRKTFAKVSKAIANKTSPLTNQQEQFAIVLDGKVISAPVVNEPILNGSAEISGNFTQSSAQSLATSLKYGALPLRFKVQQVVQQGPTLAGDQLNAGLLAGAVGLALVMLYCMFYYRGLGVVVLASLVIAGLVTYAVVLAMSAAVGFTLTLPGIAGFIVAVGITADSFIVYFERLRDEMREGKSMRVAVEAGWIRARATCLAADGVSLLAAVVLYIFAIGVVKGFAFALGISTVIDLVVFFLFTKPMVTWLATFRFYSAGHKLSGLSPDHIGIDRIGGRPSTAGGSA
ncbi:MAG TPA: protein translocase subunit SecD [Nocardioidaceae bacterium]|nr:protein translocase subunit SecD [Nocardioidaceae bacterium]